ncbi:PaaX family transcriptional regulator C-terminal domain-containing protein [Actinomadura sp. NBRC 104412]|uniref:PaaX family transcriptional regulator n=1 Tax=Actinomadura sp. NBRC 104412 TaxID=3032203 RepID=UPI002553B106|nr:PaaX family transcriptional regulator C-terminal domain-containing protein [Actinomadura sp. NBRC 104412]
MTTGMAARARGPQRLLMMLLGDYWFERAEALPSAALVALLGEFGVTEVGARAALNRQARRGLLRVEKRGRRTYYALTPLSGARFAEGGRRLAAFGADPSGEAGSWDGRWALVAFSVPENRRAARHALREQLRWLGYAPLYDGLWVSPYARDEEVREVLAELGVESATLFSGTLGEASPAGGDPIRAWDLVALRSAYERFIADWEVWRERAAGGAVSPIDALRARTELILDWRELMNGDPGLPAELLPGRWPRASARRVFGAVYDALGPLAEFRVRQIIAAEDPEPARLAMHHTLADLARI